MTDIIQVLAAALASCSYKMCLPSGWSDGYDQIVYILWLDPTRLNGSWYVPAWFRL